METQLTSLSLFKKKLGGIKPRSRPPTIKTPMEMDKKDHLLIIGGRRPCHLEQGMCKSDGCVGTSRSLLTVSPLFNTNSQTGAKESYYVILLDPNAFAMTRVVYAIASSLSSSSSWGTIKVLSEGICVRFSFVLLRRSVNSTPSIASPAAWDNT